MLGSPAARVAAVVLAYSFTATTPMRPEQVTSVRKATSPDVDYWIHGRFLEDPCTCQDGNAATGSECDTPKAAKCVSCDAGFTLDVADNSCKAPPNPVNHKYFLGPDGGNACPVVGGTVKIASPQECQRAAGTLKDFDNHTLARQNYGGSPGGCYGMKSGNIFIAIWNEAKQGAGKGAQGASPICKACDETLSGARDAGYRGCQSKTKTGKTCQKWAEQVPHTHNNKPSDKPDMGLEGHNYCRNPDAEDTIWCYTTTSLRWEYCIPQVPVSKGVVKTVSVEQPFGSGSTRQLLTFAPVVIVGFICGLA